MSQYDFINGSIGGDDDDDDDLSSLIGEDDDGDSLLESLLVSGSGTTEIVGALKAHARKRHGHSGGGVNRNVSQRLMNALVSRNAGAVIDRGLHRRRRYPLGFMVTSVPGGAIASIPSAPQNLFRAERIVVPSDIAFDFGVQDIKVGNQSQLVQSVEVPAVVFSEVAIDTNIGFDTAEVGNQLSLSVRNKTVDPIVFSAAAIGTVAK